MPSLEITKVVFVQFNLVDGQYQQKSDMLYPFTPNKFYSYLLNIEQSNLVVLETYSNELDDYKVIFTDQNGRPLETEDKVTLTLLIIK